MEYLYPKARRDDIVDDFHGTKVSDPYRWMESHDDPEIIRWINEQNQLVDNYIDDSVFEEYKARFTDLYNYQRITLPIVRNNTMFYYKNDGLQPQPLLMMKKRDIEELLFDPNSLSEDGTTAIMTTTITKDAALIAFTVAVHGSDWQEIRVFDLESREFLSDNIKNVRNGASVQWLKDNSGFYYSARVGRDDTFGGTKLWWHQLRTPQTEDKMVYEHPEDEELGVYSQITLNQDHMFLYLSKSTMPRNMLYHRDLESDVVTPIIDVLEYSYFVLGIIDGKMIIRTNKESNNNKIIQMELFKPETEIDLIPEIEFPLQQALLSNNYLVLSYLKDVSTIVKVYSLNGEEINEVKFPTFGTIAMSGKEDQEKLFFSFTSFTQPDSVYTYDFENKNIIDFHIPSSSFNPENYAIEQLFYSSNGIQIPMYIMYKKGLDKNGTNPTILHGYGGFNISLTPEFHRGRRGPVIAWLDKGGVYAIANLRGGGEYGKKWHEAGILDKKQNVFNDFIAASEYLIREKFTNTKKIAIIGGSNGGLLIGACMTQRPYLFGACVSQVGVLDMLRYHKFTIGRYWVPEYGNPENPDHFKFLYKYSPLHNVKQVSYPPTLVHTADTDDRVDPAHSKKFIAELQAVGKGGPLFIRVIKNAGHHQGKPVTKTIEDMSYEYAFIQKALSTTESPELSD